MSLNEETSVQLCIYAKLPENVNTNTSNKSIVQWYGGGGYSLVRKLEKLEKAQRDFNKNIKLFYILLGLN